MRHGPGVLTFNNRVYEGEWRNNEKNGKGK